MGAFLEAKKKQEAATSKQQLNKKHGLGDTLKIWGKKKKSLEAAVTELNTSVDTYAEKAEASTSDIMWVIQFEEDS